MPPAYVGAPLAQPSADAGSCILTPTATMIRPKIGGSVGHGVAKQHLKQHSRRKSRGKKAQRKHRKSRRQRAGFLPSIGEPFSTAVGNYVAPIALYGLYKFLNGTKGRKKGSKTKKSK
jgi:hypothetical protein